MKVIWGLDAFQSAGKICLALGTFDGLHRGHRAIIGAVQRAAVEEGAAAVVTTFDPHPLLVIAPSPEPLLLTTIEERIALFEATGIDALVIVRFTDTVREMSASEWLESLRQRLHPARIVVSSTHAFGHNREGSPAVLEAWGTRRGIGVTVVPPVTDGGTVVSSTAIRDRLRAGDVRAAAAWLGRWYSATGAVIPGEGRGKTLGFPTANLHVPPAKVIPRQGVYAAYATVDGQTYPAAVNIGVRPTFGGGGPSVEAHLIGADLSLYGRSIALAFVEHLRPEQRFSSADALRAQISADVEKVGEILQTEADWDAPKPA